MSATTVPVRRGLWKCLDGFICIFILAPLVVFYWRGTFQLLDIYTFPSDLKISSFMSFAVGILGTLMINFLQNILHVKVPELKPKAFQIVCKRLYTYTFGWIIVHHWRGVWRLWDAHTGQSLGSNIISFTSGCLILLVLKSFRNVVAPPLVTVSDFDSNYFIIKTRFRTKPSHPLVYILDNVFSVVVPGSLVVSVWRGQWGILDHLLWCESLVNSCLISGALGFSIIVILFMLQLPAAYVSKSLEKRGCSAIKILFEDCFFCVACFGAVNIWRSVWGLCDQLLLTHDYELSNWVCHLIGALGTMILLHGNTVLVRDVQIDGEYSNGEGCWFFSKSLTIFDKKSSGFLPLNQKQNSVIPELAPNLSKTTHKDLTNGAESDASQETSRMLEEIKTIETEHVGVGVT